MYFVYILKSLKTDELYKGITNDLQRRIIEHNSNKNIGSRGKGPWRLVYFEEHSNRIEARKREKYFKSGSGREFLKIILNTIPCSSMVERPPVKR
ncbi:MAG: GIY-YIG nuclease family protein [Candidatus Shapirobacteria bacterium]|nr:GIY-YIG nuclease family protein [Candidatus Shapirobacteria bacterium]